MTRRARPLEQWYTLDKSIPRGEIYASLRSRGGRVDYSVAGNTRACRAAYALYSGSAWYRTHTSSRVDPDAVRRRTPESISLAGGLGQGTNRVDCRAI